jgi:hypothetical protein
MLSYNYMILLQSSQNKMHRLCIIFPAILFFTLNALFQTYTNVMNSLVTGAFNCEIQFTQPLC